MIGLISKYFVIKPKGNNAYAKASRDAMSAYANSIADENVFLSRDLREWVLREEEEIGL